MTKLAKTPKDATISVEKTLKLNQVVRRLKAYCQKCNLLNSKIK